VIYSARSDVLRDYTDRSKEMAQLPVGFENLEQFVGYWAIDSRAERFNRRVATDYGAIKNWYKAMLLRMEEAVRHLNVRPVSEVDRLQLKERNLFLLCLSFMEVAAYVECWEAPDNYALSPNKVKILL